MGSKNEAMSFQNEAESYQVELKIEVRSGLGGPQEILGGPWTPRPRFLMIRGLILASFWNSLASILELWAVLFGIFSSVDFC